MRRRILRTLDALVIVVVLAFVVSLLLASQQTISTAEPPSLTVATSYVCASADQPCSNQLSVPGDSLTQSVVLTAHGQAVTPAGTTAQYYLVTGQCLGEPASSASGPDTRGFCSHVGVTVQSSPHHCLFPARPTPCPPPSPTTTLADLASRTLLLTSAQPAHTPYHLHITTTMLPDITNADQGLTVHIPLSYQISVLPPGAG